MNKDNKVEPVSGMAHKCTASTGVNKFICAGQAMLQESTGRHPLMVTTIVCQVCGFVGVNTIQMNLPIPTNVSIPTPETGVKPVRH